MTNNLQIAREKKDKITSWRNGKCKKWHLNIRSNQSANNLLHQRRVCITTSRNAKIYRKPFQDTFQEKNLKRIEKIRTPPKGLSKMITAEKVQKQYSKWQTTKHLERIIKCRTNKEKKRTMKFAMCWIKSLKTIATKLPKMWNQN